jgi:hypothetical protein
MHLNSKKEDHLHESLKKHRNIICLDLKFVLSILTATWFCDLALDES